jgi:hypothetical protein
MAAVMALGQDRRRRNLTILGGVTILFLLLAVVAVLQRAGELAPKFDPRAFFPGLPQTVNNLGEVTVVSKTGGTIHVKLMNDNWVVEERNNFPADQAQMRATAVGIADLQILEPKTARADWLGFLGLTPPPDGEAVRVTLTDTSGKMLADLLLGHAQGNPDDLGRSTLYVKKPDDAQSWLARGYLTPKPNISDWLNKGIVDIARDRVKGAVVTPATGPGYTLSRDTKDAQDFKLLDLPRGRELAFEGSPDGVAGAIVGFQFDDVAKADPADYAKAPQSVFNTFDGLAITVKIATKGMDHWATVSASASNPMAQDEAMKLNAAVNGWAFKLPESKVLQILAARETLLKPPPGK